MFVVETMGRIVFRDVLGPQFQIDLIFSEDDRYAFIAVFHTNLDDMEETVTWSCSVESLNEAMECGFGGFGDMVFEIDGENFLFQMQSHEGQGTVAISLEVAKEFHSGVIQESENLPELSFTDDDLMEWLA